MSTYYVDNNALKNNNLELIHIYENEARVANNPLTLNGVRKWLTAATKGRTKEASWLLRGTFSLMMEINLEGDALPEKYKTILLETLQPTMDDFLARLTRREHTHKEELRCALENHLLNLVRLLENNLEIKNYLTRPEDEHFIARIIELNSQPDVRLEGLLQYIQETETEKLMGIDVHNFVGHLSTTTEAITARAGQAREQIKFSKLYNYLIHKINELIAEIRSDTDAGPLDWGFKKSAPRVLVEKCKVTATKIKALKNTSLMNEYDFKALLCGYEALEYEDDGIRKLVINNRKYLEVLPENAGSAACN